MTRGDLGSANGTPAGPARLPLLGELRRARLVLPPPAPGESGATYRRSLADLTDAALAELWEHALATTGLDGGSGVALTAVGSLGRRDGGPVSDLDLLLVHDDRLDDTELTALAEALWYPVWDAGIRLDHAVRTLEQCRTVASADLPAAVGLLHLRTVAGDQDLGERAARAVLADWRSGARRRLEDLVASVAERAERFGEVAYLLEPDLKEARGGLRDAVVVEALVASWLTDRPHRRSELDRAYAHLLDVRDALAATTHRATTTLRLADQDEVAGRLGFLAAGGVVGTTSRGTSVSDAADDLLASIAGAARVISHALDETVRRARGHNRSRSAVPPRPRLVRGRVLPPRLPELAPGLLEHEGEIVLAGGVDPAHEPLLTLHAAAVACRTGLPLSPAMLDSLGRAAPLPEPWPAPALDLLLEILASGPAQVPVWEALDLAGVVTTWLPEWAAVRNRPQRNPLHRFTVDRHLIETAAGVPHTGAVDGRDRADRQLLLAAFLHDIGKLPGRGPHAEVGAEIAGPLLDRIGVDPASREVVVLLVREHLLLPAVATSRDLEDPEVVEEVAAGVEHRPEVLTMLRRLTEADARAAGPQAWTSWRARLVDVLTDRVRAAIALP
ncbi:HD domain-containing protein [Georgenia alba]|uniref:HD domain-containing protein n=1 Tax=Georgenia alba TaxID=2233858 RepID=A0ABW2Q6Y3_9MICO